MPERGRGSGLIPLGRLTKTVGLRGELRLKLYNPQSEHIDSLRAVYVVEQGGEVKRELQRVLPLKGAMVRVQLAQIDSLQRAQELIGCEVLMHRDDAPADDEDRHYWQDLVGLQVVEHDGRTLGKVTDLLETGANDVLVVRDAQGRELLLPNIPQVVLEVLPEQGLIRVRLLPGLLEDDEA
ncbi:MAG: ribosome maturation factor RimM [Candidatus Alcyoniella australis]|nr:ribosome maturation factor RimM [Candidatus Alcyoniella australis]